MRTTRFPHHQISKHHLNALDVVANACMKGAVWRDSIMRIAKLGSDLPLLGWNIGAPGARSQSIQSSPNIRNTEIHSSHLRSTPVQSKTPSNPITSLHRAPVRVDHTHREVVNCHLVGVSSWQWVTLDSDPPNTP
jgi:hypothetical protein